MRLYTPLVLTLILTTGFVLGCNSGDKPYMPNPVQPAYSGNPVNPSHELMGFWRIRIDDNGVTVTDITTRDLLAHFNVKFLLKPPKCDYCIKFSNLVNDTENNILSADVTISNPSLAQGADVRGIIISNKPDVYLLNPDDYTTLYDDNDPPDKNAFRRFGKDNPNGLFFPLGEETEFYELYYGSLPLEIDTAFDVIYPANSPREPYEISNQKISGDLDLVGEIPRTFEVDVFDRDNNVGDVRLVSDELGIDILLEKDPGVQNRYNGTVKNENEMPAGDYECLIVAADADPMVTELLYDYITITVAEKLGEWDLSLFSLGTGCPPDVGMGYDLLLESPIMLFGGGADCAEIRRTLTGFTDNQSYFNLNNIDPEVPGFSPYPVKCIDSAFGPFNAGIGFFADSDEIYDDGFYQGPVSSLLVTIYQNPDGPPFYINPGDGDAGIMYPTSTALSGLDVTDGINGELYGLWADPAGEAPYELYGTGPDYTRHDVFMGGPFDESLIGEGEGKVSSDPANIRGFDVLALGIDTGIIYILESDGTSSEIEVIEFTADFILKITSFDSVFTVPLEGVEAVDIDIMFNNINYLPNPEDDTLAVLINGSSGGYLRMYNLSDFEIVEEVGSDTEPLVTGTAASCDFDNIGWEMALTSGEGDLALLKWVL